MLSRQLIIGFFIVGLFLKCTTNQILLPSHHTYISFGSVGGFAGKYSDSRLLPNGQLYKRVKHKGDFTKQKNLSVQQTKQFYSILNDLYHEKYEFNEPGNITYYLKWIDKNEQKFEVVWGGDQNKVDDRVVRLYTSLRKMSADLVYTR